MTKPNADSIKADLKAVLWILIFLQVSQKVMLFPAHSDSNNNNKHKFWLQTYSYLPF